MRGILDQTQTVPIRNLSKRSHIAHSGTDRGFSSHESLNGSDSGAQPRPCAIPIRKKAVAREVRHAQIDTQLQPPHVR
jgi:hypothetical protein